ncbi:hypothetical protein INT45_002957, partial [Circinella minor]
DSSPTIVQHHSTTYDPHPFQTTSTTSTTVDAMQLYNNEVLESSRFVTTKNNDDGIYSPAKALPMSSPTTSSSSSWHYNSTMGESSRSPYASTLSDQSDRSRLLLTDSPPLPPATSTTNVSSSSSTTTTFNNNDKTTSTIIIREEDDEEEERRRRIRGDTPGSTDSPVSPIPMDRSPHFIHEEEDSPELHHHHYQPNNSIATLYARKNKNETPILTITGETVNKDNIEEGYVQFILHHDPQSINDSIESLMYVKRKFSAVPKTGDLAYTTWDVFTLVKKLHNQQIKNWSQLVGQLGLSDMTGRPQFAQRVKRWMRKYRIDCYFDYLLGNSYNYHSPDEKNTGCLMMGNYQKRNNKSSSKISTPIMSTTTITDETDSIQSSNSTNGIGNGRTRKRSRYYLLTDEDDNDEAEEEEDEEENNNNNNGTSDDETKRKTTPIVLAGSRKRARMSPHHVYTENFRFSKTLLHQHRLSELENNDDTEDDEGGYDDDPNRMNNDNNNNNNEDEMDNEDEEQVDNNNEDDQMEEGDEEDELASTSSSSTISQPPTTLTNNNNNNRSINAINTTTHTSPISSLLLNNNNNSTTTTTTTTTANITQTAGPSTSSLSQLPLPSLLTSTPSSSCSNCNQIQSTVHSLQEDVQLLKEQVLLLQNNLNQEISSKQIMEKRLSSICSHYDNWRSKLAIQLLQNPFNPDRMDLPSNLNNNNP